MFIQVLETTYKTITSIKTTPYELEKKLLESEGYEVIAHIMLDTMRNEIFLAKFTPVVHDNILTLLTNNKPKTITERKIVNWAEDADALLKNGWELVEIRVIDQEEHKWDEEFELVKRETTSTKMLDDKQVQKEQDRSKMTIFSLNMEADKMIMEKILNLDAIQLIKTALCYIISKPTIEQGNNEIGTTQLDFSSMLDKLLSPIKDQIFEISKEVTEIKSKIGENNTIEKLQSIDSGQTIEVIKPVDDEIIKQTFSENENSSSNNPKSRSDMDYLQCLQKEYHVTLSEKDGKRLLNWSRGACERYVRRLYAQRFLRAVMRKNNLNQLPNDKFSEWSGLFAESNMSEQELRENIRDLLAPSTNQSHKYISARKEVVQIAKAAGFNEKTAGKSFSGDIDALAQELAASEAQDEDDLRNKIRLTFEGAVQNHKLFRKDVE
jgi:hypothetical protein